MRKRLLYAMPRVPINQLKNFQGQGNAHKPVSHVTTLAKRITNGKRQRQNPDDFAENAFDTQNQRNAKLEKEPTIKRKIQLSNFWTTIHPRRHKIVQRVRPTRRRVMGKKYLKALKIKRKTFDVEHFDLHKREQTNLRKIERRLREVYQREGMRFVLVDSDSSNSSEFETGSDVTRPDLDVETDTSILNDENVQVMDVGDAVRVEFDAEVHHEPESDEELEGAVGGVVEEPLGRARDAALHFNKKTEMNPADLDVEIASDSSSEYDHSNTKRVFKGWFGRRRKCESLKMGQLKKLETGPAGIQWGKDERSDSDSDKGWMNDEGTPLL